jgi:putative protein kinase ArgK-like GTPase of G3E family
VQYALPAQSEETEIWEIFTKQEEGKMELFEEVGQTLSRAGQGLAQKARDTAQVTKLKLAVSEDERSRAFTCPSEKRIAGCAKRVPRNSCRPRPHPSRSRLC